MTENVSLIPEAFIRIPFEALCSDQCEYTSWNWAFSVMFLTD